VPVYLAIDYGSRRIGLAVSDLSGRMAMPAEVISGRNNPVLDAEAVWQAAQEYDADVLVVGLPLNMDGSEGPQARHTRRFAEALAKVSGKPVDFQDERLSSSAAELLLRDHQLMGRGRQRKPIDNIAAQITLQSYLDARSVDDAPE